jgi:uncharacterized protein
MQLDLSRVRQPLSHVSRTLRPEEIGSEDGAYRITEPVALEFDLHKDRDKFRLVGTLRTSLELECSRCLDPFAMAVATSFDLRFHPVSAMSAGHDGEVREGDLETGYYRDDQIDLGELVREQCYLALPMKPLCRDECRGLCPQCGTNLTSGACACTADWDDPRFAALRALVAPKREA